MFMHKRVKIRERIRARARQAEGGLEHAAGAVVGVASRGLHAVAADVESAAARVDRLEAELAAARKAAELEAQSALSGPL